MIWLLFLALSIGGCIKPEEVIVFADHEFICNGGELFEYSGYTLDMGEGQEPLKRYEPVYLEGDETYTQVTCND